MKRRDSIPARGLSLAQVGMTVCLIAAGLTLQAAFDFGRYVRTVVLGVALLTFFGCSATLGESKAAGRSARSVGAEPVSPRCASLSDRTAFYGGAGKAFAVLGGGAGLGTIPAEDMQIQTALAVGSAVSAALAVGALYVSEQSAASWAKECAQ